MPRKVWIAIGRTDWVPVPGYPPLRVGRLSERYLHQGIEHYQIAGVSVRIYSVPKTIADLFRNPGLVDRSVAIEGLRAALDQRKATPAALADAAKAGGAWKTMRPRSGRKSIVRLAAASREASEELVGAAPTDSERFFNAGLPVGSRREADRGAR